MKERPIPMQGDMVRATLADLKTQTRRIAKPKRSIEPMTDECPHGLEGDRLWIREAWRASSAHNDLPPRDIPKGDGIEYEADIRPSYLLGRRRPAMFMPRWASRITLEVTEVRVERLQDISDEDAVAEGIYSVQCNDLGTEVPYYRSLYEPRDLFRMLWESINGPSSWASNPWVWCITFKRIKP